MQSKIARTLMSGLGVATLATLSLFVTKNVDQTTGTDQNATANDLNAAKQRLACHASNHYCTPAIGGVRG